jgi:hypothetical protein
MKVQRPFLAVIALILFVSMACKTLLGPRGTATPEEEPQSPTPQATRTARPTETAQATEGSPYFTEEFDTDPKWKLAVIPDNPTNGQPKSDPESVKIAFSDSHMVFNIPESWLSVFYTYTEETYKDVRLDIEFDNRGVNSQQISLVCRSDLNDKSYEVEVGNDGKWVFKVNRRIVSNGASTAIKTGKGINQYTMICKGNEITFLFNGVKPKGSPYVDTQVALGAGHVGLVVTSKKAVPVDVELDWYQISEP